MNRGFQVKQAVEHVVALRCVAPSVASPRESQRLRRVERELRREIGVGVPKTRAAAVLGVSVTALDKWIARGLLPVVRRPGSSREEIDADALLDLAEEVTRLREAGRMRGVLAAAFRRLAESGRPRPKLRPNQSARELREHYLATTPRDRLREVAELSRVLTGLARGRSRGEAARGRR
jgi:SRSO17 transposase